MCRQQEVSLHGLVRMILELLGFRLFAVILQISATRHRATFSAFDFFCELYSSAHNFADTPRPLLWHLLSCHIPISSPRVDRT